ncbi:hypothetical protein ASE90_09895 [Sphingomonas sp. Leaf67]|uniref:DUF6980 family protein n=1 Tax=Sphingomonas sp. Leaf67 TaxID=1736230 RepID=UPI0006FC85A4|nr:hypothetical protein [Sphingomonas sp. Leaf67]KQN82012.1 hypothetical protein ASE90_09895 [Sphingomonas sp. Leaf67]
MNRDRNRNDAATDANHMDQHSQNGWGSVRYDSRFDEYWIPAGKARQTLFFCPWCGVKLPPSQRDRWFDQLEALGFDPWEDKLPEPYRNGAWRDQASQDR